MSETRAAVAPEAFDLVWIEGPDAVSFADGQLSQDLAAMAPGGVRRSLLLEPRGKLRAILWALRGSDVIGLAAWAGTGEQVAADLDRYRFRVDATIELDPGAASAVLGPDHGEPGTWEGARHRLVARMPAGAWPQSIVAGEAPDGPTLDAAALALARVRAGEPVFGIDVDEGTIPQETGLVPEAVSFTKGCYLGQELVARIDSRGHVNRALRRLLVAGPAPTGARIEIDGETVGTLGTVAATGEGVESLALVRREAGPGDRVEVVWPGGSAAGTILERVHTLRTPPAEDEGTMEAPR